MPFEGNMETFIDKLLITLKQTIKNSIEMALSGRNYKRYLSSNERFSFFRIKRK